MSCTYIPVKIKNELEINLSKANQLLDLFHAERQRVGLEVVTNVLRQVLKREPTAEDFVMCSYKALPGCCDAYLFLYGNMELGRIVYHTTEVMDNPSSINCRYSCKFVPSLR